MSDNIESTILAKVKSNYANVNQLVQKICKDNNYQQVRLVAVSKTKPNSLIQALYDDEVKHFGESYVQELIDKSKALPKDIHWHFIGNLQSNKCKSLAGITNLKVIETLDSLKKAKIINENRNGLDKIDIFIQINTSGEENKAGMKPNLDEIKKLSLFIKDQCLNLNLKGLMTIGSKQNSLKDDGINPDFKLLSELALNLNKDLNINLELSMGMSNDFEQAIKQGSTNIRIGSTIFGEREYK